MQTAARRAQPITAFAESTTQKTVKFSVRHSVKFGQRVAVVGAPPALGSWDAKKAIEMRWNDDDVWTVEGEVPAGPLELKFVVVDDSSVKWSPGPNIVVEVPEDAAAVEVVAAGWEGASFEAKIEKATAPVAAAPVAAAPAAQATAAAAAPTHANNAPTTPSPAAAASTAPTVSRAATAAAVADFLSKPAAPAGSGAAGTTATAAVDAAKLPSLTVPKLKALAQELGVPTQGKKAELVARLQAALQSK